jgi:hypothetical protein
MTAPEPTAPTAGACEAKQELATNREPYPQRGLATELAAQAWCTPETSGIEMDVRLAEAFARILAGWLDTAAMFHRNQEFYQGIVRDIGNVFGVAARTSDDGSVQDDVLALRVPELVKELHASIIGRSQ